MASGLLPCLLLFLPSSLGQTCCSVAQPSQSFLLPPSPTTCPQPALCPSTSSCILRGIGNTSGIEDTAGECRLTQDSKAGRLVRNITEVVGCLQGNWKTRQRFQPPPGQGLPFLLEMYSATTLEGLPAVGLDLRLHYIEFQSTRCDPRCVRYEKTERRDNQVFLSYDCEAATVPGEEMEEAAEGDTYLLSVCMTNMGEARECGEFWFLVPPVNSTLDKASQDHRVLLLVDKEEYDTKSEVIVYVPTSHVTLHQADILSIQLLHDAAEESEGGVYSGEGCWHGRPLGRVIHTQNVTFTKDPGHNIRVRITHNLPSGRYQVIFSGLFSIMYSRFREDEGLVKEPTSVVVVADLEMGEEHNLVMDKFFQYLRTQNGVDRVYYVRDSEHGSPRGGERAWWRRALRDPRFHLCVNNDQVLRDGFLVIVAGPGGSPGEGRSSELVEYQLSELNSQGEEQGVTQLSLQTCITQHRFALLRLPYSDLRSLPRQLPFLVRYNTVISVPLEMRELLRQIQHAEQLSPAIHWHGNLSDSDMGRDLLVSINALCGDDRMVHQEVATGCQGKPWVTMLQSSVSFLAGHDEVLSVMVPLADGESEEEELIPSRRASLRSLTLIEQIEEAKPNSEEPRVPRHV